MKSASVSIYLWRPENRFHLWNS